MSWFPANSQMDADLPREEKLTGWLSRLVAGSVSTRARGNFVEPHGLIVSSAGGLELDIASGVASIDGQRVAFGGLSGYDFPANFFAGLFLVVTKDDDDKADGTAIELVSVSELQELYPYLSGAKLPTRPGVLLAAVQSADETLQVHDLRRGPPSWSIGTYTGDGSTSFRTITLGFMPVLVFVAGDNSTNADIVSCAVQALKGNVNPTRTFRVTASGISSVLQEGGTSVPRLHAALSGFMVRHSALTLPNLNISGSKYFYASI